jgi:ParB-like partition proteins
MNLENKKLGRGLGSLLSPSEKKDDKDFKYINISQIKANETQPRQNFKKEELEELAESIRHQGILQPIVVRPISDKGYEIVAGERRWRSAQMQASEILS